MKRIIQNYPIYEEPGKTASLGKDPPTDGNSTMTQILELSEKDIKSPVTKLF